MTLQKAEELWSHIGFGTNIQQIGVDYESFSMHIDNLQAFCPVTT